MNTSTATTRPQLGTDLLDYYGGQEFWPTFASATKNFAPLICRVVRAVLVLGAGLGFPVGAPAVFTPNLRSNKSAKGRLRSHAHQTTDVNQIAEMNHAPLHSRLRNNTNHIIE